MNQLRQQNVLPSCLTVSSESDLKDERVVLYEILYGTPSSEVLPVGLKQCGTKDYGQVMEVHLVQLRKTLHTETQTGKTDLGINGHTQRYQRICVRCVSVCVCVAQRQ